MKLRPGSRSDILIVGAGPAGTAAAIEAARRGLEVTVVDKATFPRQKCCGDGLTTGALRHLEELGFDPATVPSWQPVDDVTLVSPRGREIGYRFPVDNGIYAVAARRSELDHALVDLARRAGASVLEGCSLTGIETDNTGVTATVSDTARPNASSTIEAKLALAADGMWSPTRRFLGIDTGGYRGEWHAFRQYYVGVSGRASRELIVWFDPELLPGYLWSFPLAHRDGAANVGFGILRRPGQSVQAMGKLWPSLLANPTLVEALGPNARPEGPHRAWPIPARLGRLPLSQGRVLFVGDAAAAADPMSGEGIGQAIETGRLAAELFVTTGGDPAATARQYEQAVRRGMVRDHALARGLSAVLANPFGAEVALGTTAFSSWTRRNFLRWLFEDYPRAAVFNPRRWRGLLAAPPGAFRDNETGNAGSLRQFDPK